jgi:hypothetical protein
MGIYLLHRLEQKRKVRMQKKLIAETRSGIKVLMKLFYLRIPTMMASMIANR